MLGILAACVPGDARPSASPSGSAGPSAPPSASAQPSAGSPGPGSPDPSASASPTAVPTSGANLPDGVLMEVELRGGECPEGPCGSLVTLTSAGQISRDGGTAATVPQPLLSSLVDVIRGTDFAVVLSRPFTGECPTAVDGQETIYRIASPGGVVEIASCTVAVNPEAPLFSAISRVVRLAPAP